MRNAAVAPGGADLSLPARPGWTNLCQSLPRARPHQRGLGLGEAAPKEGEVSQAVLRRSCAKWPAACLAGLGLALAVSACADDAGPGGEEASAAAVLIAAAQGQVGSDAAPFGGSPYGSYLAGLFAGNQRDLSMAAGDVIIIRYADDIVLGFQHEDEARAFLRELQERMRAFELALHPDKTRLIRFGRYAAEDRKRLGQGKPETFDFLGFTHFCTRSWITGAFVIGRKTIKKRMRARLQAIKMELRRRRHDPIAETGGWLNKVLTGHLNYFAVPLNARSVTWFFSQVKYLWRRALGRRSQRASLTWAKFSRLVDRFFPPIRILHPLPCHRFDAKTRGRSPVR